MPRSVIRISDAATAPDTFLDFDSEDDDLKVALEMSLMETKGGSAGCSSQTEDEEEDFNRAVELSLLGHQNITEVDNFVKKSSLAAAIIEEDNDSNVAFGSSDLLRNGTIEIFDEFDSLCEANSSTQSLRERLTSNSIVITSDTSLTAGGEDNKIQIEKKFMMSSVVIDERPPVEMGKKKKVLKRRAKKIFSKISSNNQLLDKKPGVTVKGPVATGPGVRQSAGPGVRQSAGSSRHLSSRFDTESDDEKFVVNNKGLEECLKVKKASDFVPPQPSLSTEEVAARMRNVFESGLAIHFSGEEMEACKAVSTSLFPHQRVALAWMFKHENKETDGMRGGILADDMGLGKTLTVISLIMTNHWDGKPLTKPELGFTRQPFNIGQRMNRGKGKVGGAFKPKASAEVVGVGSKIRGGGGKKTTIGGLFDKFEKFDSEKENKPAFIFDKQKMTEKTSKLKKQFLDDNSSDSDPREDSDMSEDEFDKMSSNTVLFKSSTIDLFKKEELDSEEGDDENLSGEELMLSMIPTNIDFDSKLNVDGFVDGITSSDDEDCKGEDNKGMRKRKFSTVDIKERMFPGKKLKTSIPFESDGESDASLPEVHLATPPAKSESSSLMSEESPDVPDSCPVEEKTDDGLTLIIPPKNPADRAGRRRATLLVCPASLIGHWVEQLQQHLHKSVDIKLKVHHGVNKSLTGADLESHDVVITTYGTLAAEWGGGEVIPLTRAKWLRVVMDEGHNIKNHNSKSAKAAMSLDTIRRWIVSGTPIQNNLMELWSLVNWLNFGMYCGKSQMKVFKIQIEGPCKKGIPVGFERLQVLMDTICIRRTKTDRKPNGSPLVVLPGKTVLTRDVEMSDEERLCYAIFHKRAQEIVGRYLKNGQLLRNYAHVLVLMMRLRQLCCHREVIKDVDWEEVLRDKKGLARQLEEYLDEDEVTNKHNSADAPVSGMGDDVEKRLVSQLRDMIRSGVSDDCSVCLDDLKSPVITPCAHVYCRACIEMVLDTIKPPTCPLCRSKIDNKRQLLEAGQDDDGEDEKGESSLADMEDIEVKLSSSKVNAVLKEMLRIQRDCPDDKIVVVSQFTSFLNILQPLIKQNNFSLVRLDGTMSHFERSETVTVFQSRSKNSPNVMLMSLKAGGVGLNLTAANHLLLLDPAWNPASEWQCFDRTHRLGQKKEVTIYKYITKDSIEEKMLEIQKKKKDLISGAFHMPAEARRRQRIDDIRNIFGI